MELQVFILFFFPLSMQVYKQSIKNEACKPFIICTFEHHNEEVKCKI